jgi:hypothetical protein
VHESLVVASEVLAPASAGTVDDVVREGDPLNDVDWNAKLARHASASFFHSSAWARVLHDTYGFKPFYLTLGNERGFHSLLPIMEVNSWLTGKKGLALPFTDECGPLGRDAASIHRLLREALDHAKARGWKYLECRGGKSFFGEVPASVAYFRHRLDLQAKESVLWARVEDSTRRGVRKAERSGLTVEFSHDLDAVRDFYNLLCRTRKRHGVPPQPFFFFQNVHRHVLSPDQGQVVLVRLGRRPVAAAIFFHFGKTAIFKFGASDDSFHRLRVNNLMMWQAIKWYAAHGFSVLDFGRTSLRNKGLRRFKKNWGTEERRIEYVRYNCRGRCFVQSRDTAHGWQNHFFRILPGRLSRLIGTTLYKHFA